ncbi:MAG: tetratricopeptide repeat protein, partial [Allosphingosinicella sp.]
ARRISPATIALVLAGLLAISAVAVAAYRAGQNSAGPPGEAGAANAMASAQGGGVDDMVNSLRERLRQDPDNDRAWFLLGLAYRNAGDFEQAEQAFHRAGELQPRNADYVAYLGETVLLKGGAAHPPPEAATLFRRALQLDAGNAQARYYLATLKDAGGDHRGAIDDLIVLLRSAPADAPWAAQVREAVVAIARENHVDLAGRLPPAPTAPPGAPQASTATAAIPGPSPEQMQAANAIPPSQQDQMVRAMVDGLAARLRQNPRDADGWIRLMRSRMVLHDAPAAQQALRSGLAAFANDAATQNRLREAAGQLGIPAA